MPRLIPLLITAVMSIAACTAIQQQKALPPVPDTAEQRNLRVLPPNITRDQLIAIMRGFTEALNVGCDHCHVRIPGGGERDFNFASDAKFEKDVARTMLIMTRQINEDFISEVNAHGQQVTCMTCHRGQTVPSSLPVPRPALE